MPNAQLQPYLFFAGCCEEAMEFYRQAVGARVEMLMRYRESPEAPPPGTVPPGYEDKVMHATLNIAGARFMASDGCETQARFEGFSLSLAWSDEAEARRAFFALSAGGEVQMPIGRTFWSPCFGMVKDRFGVGWMITVDAAASGGPEGAKPD
jgi:PhnB protein